MPAEVLNRETVLERKERLLAAYDGVHVQEVEDEAAGADDPERVADFLADCRDGYTGGGYAWVVRDPGQAADLTESMPDGIEDDRAVLMALGRGASRWGLAGGGREDGETYEAAAVREVREETGVECELTDCFLVRHVVLTAPTHDVRVHTLWVFFDARYAGGSISVQPGELNGAAWFEEPPERMLPENELRAADFWEDYEPAGDPLAKLRERG